MIQKFIQTVYFLLFSVRKMEQWSMNKEVFQLMICYLLKRKRPLTNGLQPLTAKTDINFWTFLWTPIQAAKSGAHSLKFSCVLRVLSIEKKRCGMVWQATDLLVQIQLDVVESPVPPFFSRTAGPRQVMFAKRDSEKMRLGCGGKSCRNGFLAEISSGNRPVLSVFHEIRCHQTNIGTFIQKDSNHAGTRRRERTHGLPKPTRSEHLKW